MRWPLIGREAERDRTMRALRAGQACGVLLAGTAGVGKSRLVQECLEAGRARGWQTLWVTATEGLGHIPLGLFAPVVDNMTADDDDLALLPQTVKSLQDHTRDAPLLLAVDDAHLLDDASAAVVQLLVGTPGLMVLMTVRTGEPLPQDVERLWTSGRLERIELGSLARADVEQLLEAALGGPVAASTEAALWRLSRGHPLVLHEAVHGALDDGTLSRRDGLWRHESSLGGSQRVEALVEQRLVGLSPDEHAALELVAIGEPVGYALLDRLVGARTIARLEARGLLGVQEDGRRLSVRAAHPLHREVLSARMTHGRRRQVFGVLADALQAVGLRRRDDRLRLADWQLQAGAPVEAAVLIEAARHARRAGAPERAVRMARAALGAGGVEAQLAFAEALAGAGRRADAASAYADAEALAEGERQRARAIISRAEHLLFGEHRPDEALAMVRAAREACTDERIRDELTAAEAVFVSYRGDMETVLRLAEPVLARPDASDRAVLSMLTIVPISQVMLGQPAAALEGIARGERLLPSLRDDLPMAETQLGISRLWALWALGRLREAERIARDNYRHAVDAEKVDLMGVRAVGLGLVLLERGLVDEAAHRLAEGTLALEKQDPLGSMPGCLGLRVYAAALSGATAGARAHLAALDRHHPPGEHRFMIWRGRGLAWLAAAESDADRAHRHARESAAWGHANQQYLWAAFPLHDLVRLGAPGSAVEPLDRVAQRSDTPYVDTLAAHARALDAADPDALLAVSDRLAQMGATLLAAEAASQAAAVHRRAGHERAALRAGMRMRELARQCTGVASTSLEDPPPELTERELEVARLAAQHLTSNEIAERLTISVRTVDNHLHRAYTKLGIDGRPELKHVL